VGFLAFAEFGLFAAEPAFGFGDLHAFAGTGAMRSDSNSATMARTLNSSRPTGSVGSWMEPPMLSFTFRLVRSSMMSRASGSDLASRSSWVTTRVSPARTAARASRRPRRSLFLPVSPWST
jgi:hypothetical protein